MYELFQGQGYIIMHVGCLQEVSKRFKRNVLDYGCGNGKITRVLASMSDDSHIFAYDGRETGKHFSKDTWQCASETCSPVPNITLLPHLNGNKYDTILLMCVLHGNKRALSFVKKNLSRFGNVIVFDHDKSHLSEDIFRKCLTDQDREEIRKRGFENVFRDHTSMNLDACVQIASLEGFKTIESFSHNDFDGYPFYLWVGKKN